MKYIGHIIRGVGKVSVIIYIYIGIYSGYTADVSIFKTILPKCNVQMKKTQFKCKKLRKIDQMNKKLNNITAE